MTSYRLAPLLLSICLLLLACSSSDDDGMAQVEEDGEVSFTGIFIDAAVEGLRYETATQTGLTNADGEFTYQAGEQVIFSIGGITFPSVSAQSQLSPLNLFNTSEYSNPGVINLSRLLQTLDLDGVPENGIELADNIHDLASSASIDFTSDSFDANLAQLVSDNVSSNSAVNTQLVSELLAIAHLQDTLGDANVTDCGTSHAKVGATGSFSTLAHDVTGEAEILDDCTIQITLFNYDASAPAVFFYGADNGDFSNGFIIGGQLRDDSSAYQNDTINLTLPDDKTLDDLRYLSVWCVLFSANFGSLTFE